MSQETSQIDMSTIEALQQKRTLAFVNHFVMTNVQFLNNFMRNCEQKLMEFERKLEKVNATMVLLEARLSSVPELNTQESPVKETPTEEKPQEDHKSQEDSSKVPEESQTINNLSSCNRSRPEYDRFLKMVHVGVPVQAVKIKVSLEGLDPDIFEEILGK